LLLLLCPLAAKNKKLLQHPHPLLLQPQLLRHLRLPLRQLLTLRLPLLTHLPPSDGIIR
jgi:hypothetical protein